MSTCKNCGAEIAEGTKFCSECGAKQEEIKVCSKCGAELSEEMNFCGECGEPVKTIQPVAAKAENESGAEKRSSQPAEGVQSVSGKPENEFPQKAKEFWQKLSILKKSGIIIAVVIVVLGIFAGHSSTEPTPAISVKAEEMLDDYIRDPKTAEAKYNGQQIHITGTVMRIFPAFPTSHGRDYCILLAYKRVAGKEYGITGKEYGIMLSGKKIKAVNELKKGDFVAADGIVRAEQDDDPATVWIDVENINK